MWAWANETRQTNAVRHVNNSFFITVSLRFESVLSPGASITKFFPQGNLSLLRKLVLIYVNIDTDLGAGGNE
jgi:hypothetical protein